MTSAQGGYTGGGNCFAGLTAKEDNVSDDNMAETIAGTINLHMANLLLQTAATIEASRTQVNATLQQMANESGPVAAATTADDTTNGNDVVCPPTKCRLQHHICATTCGNAGICPSTLGSDAISARFPTARRRFCHATTRRPWRK
jgi:hypothetical protein